ncbi:MAG: bifunctional 5,10-methylenetetrahydrofolate dehydrogenase/5,10-methenyltetrahydrofolate cyclohydrolase [Rhabdochlamydiaceae bacterium]|nr:bifunctional 5,10-methylenetetrahydrofolate dehydrogenase/5,10-methenyltetrahydrofolate cyclohydrolase [Rhabdochlamydiaceae bacterium]
MKLIEGRSVAGHMMKELRKQVGTLTRPPGLSFILIGEHAASHSYVRMKKKRCAEIGIISTVHELPETTSESHLLKLIHSLNQDPHIDGILVQQPLPPHLNTAKVVESVDPSKDVDGFHPLNLGKLLAGDPTGFIPCTPLGIQKLLESYEIPTDGKHVVILGRSSIVGKPLAALLVQKNPHANATVTLAHTGTKHLAELARTADILVAAMGKPLFVKKAMVKPGAVVVDVGINRLGHQIVGDVDAKDIEGIPSYLTPVPGGVGPMTIAMLLSNTLLSITRKIS